MYGNQNNLCVRLGSFTALQKREELSSTPDVCFMTQWPCRISWWVSADVKDREELFNEPLCRAGHSPPMCILFLDLAIGFSSQLSATSTHWICLMQQLCPHNSQLSSTSVLSTENNICKHLWGRNNKTAPLKKYQEGRWNKDQTNV